MDPSVELNPPLVPGATGGKVSPVGTGRSGFLEDTVLEGRR